jgi:hypothetical protein
MNNPCSEIILEHSGGFAARMDEELKRKIRESMLVPPRHIISGGAISADTISFHNTNEWTNDMNNEMTATEQFEAKMKNAAKNGIYIQPGDRGGWMVKLPTDRHCEPPLAAFSTLGEALEFIDEEFTAPDEEAEAEDFDRPATLQDIRDMMEIDGAVEDKREDVVRAA